MSRMKSLETKVPGIRDVVAGGAINQTINDLTIACHSSEMSAGARMKHGPSEGGGHILGKEGDVVVSQCHVAYPQSTNMNLLLC